MELQKLMEDLELLGIENDQAQSDKSKKYLNITRDTGQFLFVLVKAIHASQILEVGTSNGYSTIWLASALSDQGMVYTIEVNPEKVTQASANIGIANLSSKVTQLVGNASDVLADVPGHVDFIFLDADRKEYVTLAEQLFNLLKPGGLLVCDNATSHRDELEEFIYWLNHQSNLSTSLVPVGKGELLVYKGEQ
ncbi:O-methyltransferase [Celerinatantimonas diazotrophica]|uniref:Putative O-methyltransferase YrrM n=1 Tax=Celerinatantimonas diazotrophica TaxID=412034 RepID=A0A4R1KAS3_9GAMM|nr:class I SAM-dependent methyltransferase [Celerinatantimonas diazotrophica]TCK61504.1 putative O-methyltransferase YrrM [Celerinatantimonas diazotrophica]CAG9296968.1 tRNA 5-hydroxyuridine methyltransferase [Celerinatantimonas diazotrophica]